MRLNDSESAVNCLLTLYLIKRSSEAVSGITKLQKVTFAIQKEMDNKGIFAFSGEFFRWNFGPMSTEVYGTREVLVENGLVEDRALALTARGNKVLEDFAYIFGNNEEVFAVIDECVDTYAHLALPDLKEKIYSMKVVPLSGGDEQTIRDLPLTTLILSNKGFASIDIDEDDIETLEIYIDEGMYQSILRGIDDAIAGRMYFSSEEC